MTSELRVIITTIDRMGRLHPQVCNGTAPTSPTHSLTLKTSTVLSINPLFKKRHLGVGEYEDDVIHWKNNHPHIRIHNHWEIENRRTKKGSQYLKKLHGKDYIVRHVGLKRKIPWYRPYPNRSTHIKILLCRNRWMAPLMSRGATPLACNIINI